jgi:protein-tyrosine phosphatase
MRGELAMQKRQVLIRTNELTNQQAVLPMAIIPGFLYHGNYDTASRADIMKALAMTHLLNTVHTSSELYKNTFCYHTVSSTPPKIPECIDFLERVEKEENAKVMVYCMSGQSRSPTIIIAFLMKSRGWRLLESYKWVKEKRSMVNLNAEDKRKLLAYEMELFGQCSVPEGSFESIQVAGSSGSLLPFSSSNAMETQVKFSSLHFNTYRQENHRTIQPEFSLFGNRNAWSMSNSHPSLYTQQGTQQLAAGEFQQGAGFVFGATPQDQTGAARQQTVSDPTQLSNEMEM